MRFFQSALLAMSALASAALAQSSTLAFTNVPTSVTVGKSYSIEWKTSDTTSPITITLRKGPSGNLQTISTLTSTATGTTYTWIPDKSLADGSDYALQIIQGNQVSYSGQIVVSGGSPSTISSAASASTSASFSASAASVSQSVLSITTMTGSSTVSTATLSATIKITSAASTGASGTQTAAQGTPTGGAGQVGSSPIGLSTGAKIGIGLGVPLAVLIIAGLVGLGYWLGRRKKAPAPNLQPEIIAHEPDPNTRYRTVEMPTKANIAEMPASEGTGVGAQGVGPAELPESRK